MDTPSPAELAEATGGRYEIDGIFAQGGMGTVYSARHKKLGSRVAIKVLPPDIATSEMRLARFKREAALAARLSHPHIVPVFEFDVHHDLAYLVMPFVEGESLGMQLLRQGRLDYPAVKRLLEDVGAALGFAHARGVVHRDIKPDNILRETATDRWLITDFGVASTTDPDDAELTQTGAVIGTPAYMAPEQASGQSAVDGRADLYALAAVVYESLSGVRPNVPDEAKGIGEALHKARPEIRPRLARALAAPLAPRPDQRPATAEQWLESVRQSAVRRTRLPLIAAATLALAAIATWLVFVRDGAKPAATPTVAVLPFLVDARDDDTPLDSLLANAFDWQLRYLPDYRIMGPSVRQRPVARAYGAGELGLDTLLAEAARLGATLAIAGRAERRERNHVLLQIQLYDLTTRRIVQTADTAGPVDRLNDLVAGAVVRAFAEPVARDLAGWATSLPRGLEAFSAYWRGYQAFRRAAYPEAIESFEEVIGLDSAFAPAHFHRVLAVMLNARPTQATTQIRAALDAARTYRSGLDPISTQLLAGYDMLVRVGDIARAEMMFADIVESNPSAADAWFVLGYVQFFFRALLGASIGEARFAFEQAIETDPKFAGALIQLAAIAALGDDRVAGRQYIARYLAIDSTSVRAHLARMGDSLLYGGPAAQARILGSVADRPTEVLELLSLAAGELTPPAGTRPLAEAALRHLWTRAQSQHDRKVAFRMQLAHLLATGRQASADSLVREAAGYRLADDELDRWVIMSAVTPLPDLVPTAAQHAAARRLEAVALNSPEIHWLLARWYLSNEPSRAGPSLTALRRLAADTLATAMLATGLLADVEAARDLARADSAGARARLDAAMTRWDVELVPFGLTASLWPLRVTSARLALAGGDTGRALEITRTFDAMAGFVDQVAWPEVLDVRARAAEVNGDVELARRSYRDILRLFSDANGGGIATREQAERALAALAN